MFEGVGRNRSARMGVAGDREDELGAFGLGEIDKGGDWSLKVKRKVVTKNNWDLIESMY